MDDQRYETGRWLAGRAGATLVVQGVCTFPTAGWSARLEVGNQGTTPDPAELRLDLRVRPPTGPVDRVVTHVAVTLTTSDPDAQLVIVAGRTVHVRDLLGSPAVAVLDVLGEIFRVELTSPEHLDHVRGLLAGIKTESIPLANVVRGETGINHGWAWHLDPATLEWAEAAIEVCDGTPSQIEDGTFTYERFCPWQAKVIAIEGR